MRTRMAANWCALAVVLTCGAPVVAASWRLNSDDNRHVSDFFFGPDGGVTLLANPPQPNMFPFWKVPLAGGANTLVTEATREGLQYSGLYKLTADEQYLVVRQHDHPDNGDLWSIRLADGAVKRLTFDNRAGGAYDDSRFSLTPDSRHVIYVSRTVPGVQSQLFSVPVDGSSLPLQLSTPHPHGSNTTQISLSPDGQSVYYASDQIVDGRFDLFRVGPDGGGSTRVNDTPGFVGIYRFSHDGSSLVYLTNGGTPAGKQRLYAKSLVTGVETLVSSNLPATSDVERYFQFTSDNSRVVYQADHQAVSRLELFAAPVAGGPSVPLSGLPAGASHVGSWALPAESAGPNALVGFSTYDLNRQSRFFVNSLDGGEPKLLGTLGTPGGNFVSHHLQMTKPGDLLLAFVNVTTNTDVVYGFPTDGSGGFEYFGPMDEYLLHPDGKHIVYAREQGGGNSSHHLYWEPLDRSAPPLRISDEDGYPNIGRLEWSPDERHVVYMRNGSSSFSDIYVAALPVPEPTTMAGVVTLAAIVWAGVRRRSSMPDGECCHRFCALFAWQCMALVRRTHANAAGFAAGVCFSRRGSLSW